jgi:hypothetical protein
MNQIPQLTPGVHTLYRVGVRAVGCLHLLLFFVEYNTSYKGGKMRNLKFYSFCQNAENYKFFSNYHLWYLYQNYFMVVDNGQLEELMGECWYW